MRTVIEVTSVVVAGQGADDHPDQTQRVPVI